MLPKFLESQPIFLLLLIFVVFADVVLQHVFECRLPIVVSVFTVITEVVEVAQVFEQLLRIQVKIHGVVIHGSVQKVW